MLKSIFKIKSTDKIILNGEILCVTLCVLSYV